MYLKTAAGPLGERAMMCNARLHSQNHIGHALVGLLAFASLHAGMMRQDAPIATTSPACALAHQELRSCEEICIPELRHFSEWVEGVVPFPMVGI